QVVVILEFEPKLRVYVPGGDERSEHRSYAGGFVAGIDDTFTLTEHLGFQSGLQLNLHPLGARRLFGVPLSELRGTAIAFRDLVPVAQRKLSERLAELATWDQRFDLLEAFLLERLRVAPPAQRTVVWALSRLADTARAPQLAELARELGYSQKHVIALFHDQVGVPPKVWQRLLRFERLQRVLKSAGPAHGRTLAQIASECGYYDQSHLARDVRQFTGASASQLIAELPARAFGG
ncbi:MAG: hypothetical protein RL701_1391, partial [Pseudomonadota bacterium]